MCKHDKMMDQVFGFSVAIYTYDHKARAFHEWFKKQENLQEDFHVEIREDEADDNGMVLEVASYHPSMPAEAVNALYGMTEVEGMVLGPNVLPFKGNC